MEKQCAQRFVEVIQIDDPLPFGSIGDDSENGRIDSGTRPKDRWREISQDLAITLRLHPDGQGTVVLATGGRYDSFGKFLLDRDDHSFRQGIYRKEIANDGGRDIVRQIRYEFEPRSGEEGELFANRLHDFVSKMVLIPKGIEGEHRHIRVLLQFSRREDLQFAVDLDGDHMTDVGSDSLGQRSHARSDFQDHIGALQIRTAREDVQDIEIDEEVLPIFGFGLHSSRLKRAA